MFIGHYGVGLASKRVDPELPLWILLAAPQVLDLLWPLFVLAGIERVEVAPGETAFTPLRFVSYPWSHSLVMAVVWGLVVGAIWFARRKSLRAAIVLAALVVSHWLLDFISHRPDLPLWPGASPLFGLGLWASRPATLLVEVPMFAVGVALYARTTRPRDRTGTWSWVGLVAFLSIVYLGNSFGPPPPSAQAVAGSALALWLLPLWGYWIERHRVPPG